MTTLQEAAMRQSFETWAKPILGDNPTWKESGECELAWQSWKAALAQGGTLIDEGTKLTPHPSQDVPAISFGNMPHGWTHDGSNRLMSEDDAKQEAKQCGGTTRAYPLYALPQRELTDEEILALEKEGIRNPLLIS